MNKSIRYGAVVALLMIAALLVNFTIDAQGRILASEVKQSTARSSFDRDVQRQLRKASPVPPPPAKVLSGNRMTIDYPLNFTLTR